MAKQKKKAQGTCYFFDEMEGKMQEEDVKRRRLSKKTAQSQPELLFLQLYPEGKSFDSFSNKCNSQPSGSNSHRKAWRPPLKLISETETVELKSVETKNNNANVFNTHNSENIKIYSNNSADICYSVKSNLNNENYNLTNKSTEDKSPFKVISNMLEKECSYNRAMEGDKENLNLFSHLGVAVENIFPVTANMSDNSVVENFNSYALERNLSQNKSESGNPSSSDPKKIIEHSEIPSSIGTLQQNMCFVSDDRDNDDSVVEEIPVESTFPQDEQYNQDNTHQQITVENREISECAGVNNCYKFEEMPTQNNLLLTENNKMCCNKRIYEERTESEFIEHEDILYSIDMILSQGQNSNPEETVDENNKQKETEHENEKDKIDSSFSNSCNSKDHDSHEILGSKSIHSFNDCEKQEECMSVTEVLLNIKHGKNEDGSFPNFVEENAAIEKDLPENLSENKVGCHENSEEEDSLTHNEENHNETETVPKENDNNVVDDEFSCLMISNSQLLAIENSYYEAPHNRSLPNRQVPSDNEIGTEWGDRSTNIGMQMGIRTERSHRSTTVGTQTEPLCNSLQPAATYKNVLPQAPVVNWDNKMQDTHRQLRETIQEVGRLNALLLRVRQTLWPQRKPTVSSPGVSKDDNVTYNKWQDN